MALRGAQPTWQARPNTALLTAQAQDVTGRQARLQFAQGFAKGFALRRHKGGIMGGAGMTHDNSSEATPQGDTGSGSLFNTAAGWVLFAAGLGLGLSVLSSNFFHTKKPERPETMGFAIEGVVEEGAGAAEMTMAQALNMEGVDVSAGERVFAKCSACHTIEQGGANGVGPNLYGIMGAAIGKHSPGYAYSPAIASHGGNWGWEEMNEWLTNPKGFVEGTKMGFAGLSKIEDRAALALYLNSMGSNLPVPSYVADVAEGSAEEPAAEGEAAAEPAAADGATAETAETPAAAATE
jgi:cytochrome c